MQFRVTLNVCCIRTAMDLLEYLLVRQEHLKIVCHWHDANSDWDEATSRQC